MNSMTYMTKNLHRQILIINCAGRVLHVTWSSVQPVCYPMTGHVLKEYSVEEAGLHISSRNKYSVLSADCVVKNE